ncbi:peptide MFS transporter [Komagataeibacter sp. FXV3]|uniref:peptide MFS transporter n=1 Tax=Komagataeibacter sp. FXV3 TaxID=2608998 RepID=UPI00187B3907|nr:oligopeptide:H+ symporter [Komagataeibacter sp. FXV3]MBE7728606.1 MFS transporter [Komagataeibacter sp. FXV3]
MHDPDATLSHADRSTAFGVVLAMETWERFGFYGMQAILLLYMVQKLGLRDTQANMLWGSFSALTYAAPVAGGWLGDRVTGSRRTMVAGGIVLALGYLLLGTLGGSARALYLAMGVIVVGNGLFKPNSCNMVTIIYRRQDQKLDVAFTIYYMAINVGSTFSLFLTPWLQQTYGWGAAFVSCAIGLGLGTGCYFMRRTRLACTGTDPDFRPVPVWRVLAVIAGMGAVIELSARVFASTSIQGGLVIASGILILLAWVMVYGRADAAERPGLKIMYLLTFEVALYFIFYQQMVTSLTLFALRNVSKDFMLGGVRLFSLSAGQFQGFNPLWIMAGTPLLVALYGALGRRHVDMGIAVKFIIGFGCVTLSFLIWWGSAALSASPLVSPWVMLVGYGPLSLGELMISGLGLAAIARYVPARISAFMVGCYYVLIGFAMYVGSLVANMAAVDTPDPANMDAARTLAIYGDLFRSLTGLAALATLVFALLLPLVRRWERQQAG